MLTIKNDLLQIKVKSVGAELCAISALNNTNEFLWHADPSIWGSHAPNLFPIIGCMKNDCYLYNQSTYNMPKHGFLRHNKDVKIKSQTENEITFVLRSNESLYKMYPFLFEFEISYSLNDNLLIVNHNVKNIDTKTLYFSLGGHPAFNCPLHKDENYSDYFLEFNEIENSPSHLLNLETGLVTNKTKSIFKNSNRIALNGELFNEDALIFKDLKSRKVDLVHNRKGRVLSVAFEDFPYLGIWAKPKAPYVCIEPWWGIADSEDTNQKLEEKEGIIVLVSKAEFNASYSIEIDKKHLV